MAWSIKSNCTMNAFSLHYITKTFFLKFIWCDSKANKVICFIIMSQFCIIAVLLNYLIDERVFSGLYLKIICADNCKYFSLNLV